MTMRVVKSVSLPVELAEKASLLPNFSIFIQECLINGADWAKAKQIEVAAYRRQIAHREAALFRIINTMGFSSKAVRKIVFELETMGIHPEDLEDF